MSEISFLQPGWFLLLPVLAIGLLLHRRGILLTRQQYALPRLIHPSVRDGNPSSDVRTARLLPTAIVGILLITALAQPVKPGSQLSAPPRAVDLIMLIDASVSMTLQDYELNGKPVDRMQLTQVLLDRFIQHYEGKRIGLIVVGDKPHLLLKPTDDHALARHMLSRIRTSVAGRQAAIGDAIAVAADYLAQQSSPDKTELVLISDAVLPMGKLSPKQGAQQAKDNHAVLHTITIGATNKDNESQNNLIYEPADDALMQELADITGGKAFYAGDSQAMDDALQAIESHQAEQNQTSGIQLKQALYIWPFASALIILLGMTIYTPRRTGQA